jgi:BirA family biotin operon repressor/biotin-[acetyl-CoA-carboxylase] ligase
MGINVNIGADEIPPELREIATSIQIEKGGSVSRLDLLVRILECLEELYLDVRTAGFDAVLSAWRQESITLGRLVNVIAPDKSYQGTALDIDNDGALLVETARGLERVLAGDVSIRPV